MKCRNVKILFGILFLVFCASFVSSSSTYALEDIVFTFNSSNYSTQKYICSSNTTGVPSCSGYKYLYYFSDSQNITSWNYGYPGRSLNVYTSGNVSHEVRINLYFDYFLDLSGSNFDRIYAAGGSNLGDFFTANSNITEIKFILSENNPYASGITPSGSLSITENGTYDVTNYVEAVVDVPTSSGGGGGDYHQDLVDIKTGIYVCAAVLLVLYFFYCIYRMIIKSSGGWK